MAPFNDMAPLKDPFKYEDGKSDSTCYGARLGCKFHYIKILEKNIVLNWFFVFEVSRSTTTTTDPYKWESDQANINLTFADFGRGSADTGLSSGFQGYYTIAGPWIYPTPESGNEMFVNLYYGSATKECPLYCEKSGIFSEPF